MLHRNVAELRERYLAITADPGFRSEFDALLRDERSLMYVCGLAGMQVGIFQTLAARGLGAGFLDVHAELSSVPAAEWTAEQVKRRVHATRRCMLEVY